MIISFFDGIGSIVGEKTGVFSPTSTMLSKTFLIRPLKIKFAWYKVSKQTQKNLKTCPYREQVQTTINPLPNEKIRDLSNQKDLQMTN